MLHIGGFDTEEDGGFEEALRASAVLSYRQRSGRREVRLKNLS